MSEPEWAELLDLVRELSELPVRRRIATGPVADPVLRPALLACRRFWLRSGGDWKRQDLTEATFRDERVGAEAEQLRGKAESFVVDALNASDITFDLTRLNSAWIALDADLREARQSP